MMPPGGMIMKVMMPPGGMMVKMMIVKVKTITGKESMKMTPLG